MSRPLALGSQRVLGLAASAAVVGALAGAALVAPPPQPAAAQAAGQCDPEHGRYVAEAPPAFEALGIREAWRYTHGGGVTVAVVDSGVVARNVHLSEAMVPGVNVVVSDDPADNAVDTHGTAAAGIIAARAVEGSGVVGVAPEAMIAPVRVYYAATEQAEEHDVHLTEDRLAAGIAWAADSGAQIINVSISTTEDTPELRAAVRRAQDAGALVIASAGNRSTAPDQSDVPRYPAAYEDVIGVSGVDTQGRWWPQASFASDFVDLAAPGQHVPTAFLGAHDCIFEPGTALPSSSWATAYVSGVAALVASKYPEETAEQWSYRLRATATRASTGQRDDQVGWGIVRPVAALQFVDDGSARGPDSPVYGPAEPEVAPSAELDLVQHPDPMAAAKNFTRWGLIGAAVLAGLALLTARLRSAGPGAAMRRR